MCKKITFLIYGLFLPVFTFAIGPEYTPPATPSTVNDIFYSFAWGNMKGLIPSFIAIALVTFFVGIIKYIKAGDNAEQRQSGRMVMIYGLIVLFVMVSFWGFVRIAFRSFFTGEVGIPNFLPFR